MRWYNSEKITPKKYTCGHCSNNISSEIGYRFFKDIQGKSVFSGISIYICHTCHCPTFFDENKSQTPGELAGKSVRFIVDDEVEQIYNEARKCYSVGAYTSAVMCSRKLLMNISVSQGAKEGLTFADYVNYLNDSNFIPPNGKNWVDSIRKLGNEANHKIDVKTKLEASRIIGFTEMLLRFIYELPGIMGENMESQP